MTNVGQLQHSVCPPITTSRTTVLPFGYCQPSLVATVQRPMFGGSFIPVAPTPASFLANEEFVRSRFVQSVLFAPNTINRGNIFEDSYKCLQLLQQQQLPQPSTGYATPTFTAREPKFISSIPQPVISPSAPSFKRIRMDNNDDEDGFYAETSSSSSTRKRFHPSPGQNITSSAPVVYMDRTATLREPEHGLSGERRLNIDFVSLGARSRTPAQTFGKNDMIIPHGLCGVHTMYSQRWKFEILHGTTPSTTGPVSETNQRVVLTWNVTNLNSMSVISMTETPQQASLRQATGITICNRVMRKALQQRASELELEMTEGDKTPTQVANIQSLVRQLRPKQCTEGLLFFGLRHKCVHNRV